MTILVIGGTGLIGSEVVGELARRGADTRVLSRGAPTGPEPEPAGVSTVTGDVFDLDFMRDVLGAVDTVFLLTPPTPDELLRGLTLVALIREAGIRRLVHLSMIGADSFVGSARAAAKGAIEAAVAATGLPTTVLRVNALFQNDAAVRATVVDELRYPTPIGDIGMDLVDVADVAEVAALELIRRDSSADELASVTIDVVGPEVFTGQSVARLWSELLDAPVDYVGDDLAAVERSMHAGMPANLAYDLVHVFQGILDQGALGRAGAAQELSRMLGRPLGTYREFATRLLAGAG